MEKEKQPISFKAVTEGLGFHPFSDGMPYTPATPPKKQTGAGAERAGNPTFVRTRAEISPPAAEPEFFLLPQKRVEVMARPTEMPAIEISNSTARAFEVEETHGFDYLFKRSMAYVFDTCLNCFLGGSALAIIARLQNLNPELLLDPGIVLVFVAFLALMNWALITAQEVAYGSSVGKRTFGLYLDAAPGRLLARSLFFILSVVFSGVGLLWAFADPKKRCWHDVASGVQPQELARF